MTFCRMMGLAAASVLAGALSAQAQPSKQMPTGQAPGKSMPQGGMSAPQAPGKGMPQVPAKGAPQA